MKLSALATGLVLTFAIVALAGCEVRQTGEETYEVKVPKQELEEAGEKASDSAAEAGREIRETASEAAPVVQEGIRDAARATGEAMQRAGDDIQERTGRARATPEASPSPSPGTTTTPAPRSTPR